MSPADERFDFCNGPLCGDGEADRVPINAPDSQALERKVDYDLLLSVGKLLLKAIGEDTNREGLQETPRRFADAWREFIEFDAGKLDTAFESETRGGLVTVGPIQVWSMCEHHLMPFWCNVWIGYRPGRKMLGLSKFARITQDEAHKLQVQERLVNAIADKVRELTDADDVAVMGRGEHLCMTARGARSPALMTTEAVRGAFSRDRMARAEILTLMQ